VLSGSCSPDGQQTPFLPFIEVIRGSFRIRAGEAEKDVTQKLQTGLTAQSLLSEVRAALHLKIAEEIERRSGNSVSEELLSKIIDSEAKFRLLVLTTRRPEYSPPPKRSRRIPPWCG
jgi:hypothetical protein